ncbi:hypothetical protein [Flavobacterium sp.]|uniref:hypothetical protein n=1 Tax=Flavobacterium sp. TaxID=239 RepID=UPI0039E27E07
MNYKKVLLVLFVNVCIALGYYIDNRDASVLEISSDLANIIPICKKLDNPALYQNDLYLSDINDVKYYTPFYVETVRGFAQLTHGDYLQALNLLSFFSHILYGVLWFFFFYTLRRDFLLALAFSVFFRGILWPPGGELLGISSLWTIMPRTLFIALAPLPFLTYCYLKKYRMAVSGLILGLLLNFHPISGVGLLVVCAAAFVAYRGFEEKKLSLAMWRDLIVAGVFFGIGMMPYLLTYTTNIKVDLQYSQALYNEAFLQRISGSFLDPMIFIPAWSRPITFFLLIPFLGYYFFDRSEGKRNFKILLFTILVLFIAANSFVYVESAANRLLHKNIRMAFQLIRIQKLLLVLLQIGLYLFIVELFSRFAVKELYKRIAVIGFFVFLSLSSLPLFAKIPVLGDDLMTNIYPSTLKVSNPDELGRNSDISHMIDYIKQHTPKDAVFYGSFYIRAGADRSVVLDGKGAGMLIEGNANKFVQWYLDIQKLKTMGPEQKIAFLKSKKVSYVVTDKIEPGMILVNKIGAVYLFKI